MSNIINAFEAYFDSSLPKSDLAIRIAILVFAFILGMFLTYLFNVYILDSIRTNKIRKLKKENKKLKKENTLLNGRLQKYQKQIDMEELSLPDNDFDVVLNEFIK